MTEISPASIVIPTLNEEHYLPLLLESLAKIEAVMDVIVVDGNSRDRTKEVAQSFAARFPAPCSLRVMSSPRGISVQRNAGAQEAKHPILIFIDADIIIPGAEEYRDMIEEFKKGGYAVAAPHLKSIQPNMKARLVYAGFNAFLRIATRFRRPYFAGSCLLTKRDVFFALGGFNVNFPVAEDIDYACRAAQVGSCGLLRAHARVSARRFEQYGYGRYARIYLIHAFVFLTTGSIKFQQIFYPFGEYESPKR